MRITNYDTNMYPYGLMMEGHDWKTAYMPELRVMQARRDEGIPPSVLTPIMDKMNARLRAGQDPQDIEADYQGMLDDAARGL
jgi:hypothetical protein